MKLRSHVHTQRQTQITVIEATSINDHRDAPARANRSSGILHTSWFASFFSKTEMWYTRNVLTYRRVDETSPPRVACASCSTIFTSDSSRIRRHVRTICLCTYVNFVCDGLLKPVSHWESIRRQVEPVKRWIATRNIVLWDERVRLPSLKATFYWSSRSSKCRV